MAHAIRIHKTGNPDVLEWQEVEVGEPGPGQARIRQEAAGLNFIDVYHRTGLYKQKLPMTPGVEGAGRGRSGRSRRHQCQRRGSRRLCGADRRLCGGAADRRRSPGEAARRHLDRAGGGHDAPGNDRPDAAAVRLPGSRGRHDPGPRRGRRGRPHHVPMGDGDRRNGDRDGRNRRESGTRARPRLCASDRLFEAGFRRGSRAGSPTARSCRSSTIPSAAIPS